uniref:CBFD_NFYB_HMF domain-containing protein n=1 Tax=Strongyloides stercoralis TaxID=6248 RepID=A0A0K0EG36_STRER
MDFYEYETINNMVVEENEEIKNNILCPVEFEENIQQINIKKCSNKYKLIITHMKAKLKNSLEILKIAKCLTNNILSTASKDNLTSKEVPVFKKIIYDIVSYTTTSE